MKKKSTGTKGINYEKIVRDVFRNNGYDVDFKFRNQYTFQKDFFNVWDFIAIKNGLVTFVQVKYRKDGETNNVSTFKSKSEDFMIKHGTKNKYMIILIDSKREFRVWVWKESAWAEEIGLNI